MGLNFIHKIEMIILKYRVKMEEIKQTEEIMCVCVYMCVCVCIYIYIYIYVIKEGPCFSLHSNSDLSKRELGFKVSLGEPSGEDQRFGPLPSTGLVCVYTKKEKPNNSCMPLLVPLNYGRLLH